jgi:hypothetical protein
VAFFFFHKPGIQECRLATGGHRREPLVAYNETIHRQEKCPMETLTLHQAALTLANGEDGVHAAEVALARAIEHGDLHANVKRWATEQWEGKQLPGNINRLETFIERCELDAWQQRHQPA